MPTLHVRSERPGDIPGTRAVHLSAFGTSVEADLVDVLREQAEPIVSLVAEEGGTIVGHVLFTPVTLVGHAQLRGMGLGPMAVMPQRQRKGIGSALIRQGFERCRRLGVGAVVVVGHARYYPRFGFQPASRFGIDCEYDVPDDVFMVLELVEHILRGKSGTIRYHPAFANA